MSRKVYSYLRFSAAKQAEGASIARQSEYAKKWADEHGLDMDETLSMKDEGLSAYHQKHIKHGALGIFLEAIGAGRIPTGSVLVVEGLDRLSRAEPILAQAQLAQIVNAGITVVTAGDGREYSRESLKANPMDLVYSLLVMIRAHEESETKSNRVRDAAVRAAKAWQAGQRVPVPGGRVPQWVQKNGERYELIPKMAAAMRETVRLYLEGYGAVRILDELKRQGLPPVCLDRANNVDALLRNQTYLLVGTKEACFAGERYALKNYYPAIISEEDYNRLLVEAEKRKQRPHLGAGKSSVPNLFSGMGTCRCGVCGDLIVSHNRTIKDAPRGEYTYRRVRCPTCQRNNKEAPYGKSTASCAVENLELAIFDYCSDQFNLKSLMKGNDKTGELQREQTALLVGIAQAEKKVSRIAETALEGDGKIPAVLVRQMQDAEKQIVALKAREQHLAAEIAVSSSTADVDAADWAELKEAFINLDYDARRKARKLFDDTFSKTLIYFGAKNPDTGGPAIALALTSKKGERRLLVVDRKTGKTLSATRVLPVEENDNVRVAKAGELTLSIPE